MAYKSYSKEKKIGDWVYTTKVHSSLSGEFEIGSYVQIIGIDNMRGYDIQDEYGNRVLEIGWEI